MKKVEENNGDEIITEVILRLRNQYINFHIKWIKIAEKYTVVKYGPTQGKDNSD